MLLHDPLSIDLFPFNGFCKEVVGDAPPDDSELKNITERPDHSSGVGFKSLELPILQDQKNGAVAAGADPRVKTCILNFTSDLVVSQVDHERLATTTDKRRSGIAGSRDDSFVIGGSPFKQQRTGSKIIEGDWPDFRPNQGFRGMISIDHPSRCS